MSDSSGPMGRCLLMLTVIRALKYFRKEMVVDRLV